MPHEVVGFVIILIELKYLYFILFTLGTIIIIKENSSIGWLWKRVSTVKSVRKPGGLTRSQTIKYKVMSLANTTRRSPISSKGSRWRWFYNEAVTFTRHWDTSLFLYNYLMIPCTGFEAQLNVICFPIKEHLRIIPTK